MSTVFGDTISSNTSTTRTISITGVPSGSGSNSGFINSDVDQDWFRVNLRAGEIYEFQANSFDGLDPTLALRNSAGTQLAFNDDFGDTLNSLIRFTPTTTGTYFLDVGGFSSSTGAYSVSAREVPGSAATYSTLGVTGTRSGDLHAVGDHDWHAVNLVAGQTYTFQLRGSGSDGGTLSNAFLTLRNSAGAAVVSDDNGGIGSDSFIQFTASTSGRYYLDAGAFNNAATGTYNLTARSFSTDDVAATTSSTSTIAISGVPNGAGSQAGIINSDPDQDWYRITLRAGEQYEFLATAPNGDGAGTVLDPTLTLRNSAGTQLAFNDDSGGTLDSRLLFTANTAGTYYLDVGGFSSSTGAYVLQAHEVPGRASTHASMSVGTTRTGDIHASGDHDWVAINLVAGQSYNFQQRGSPTSSGTLSDTFLFLRNSSGTIVAQDDDSGVDFNSLINFTASTSGRYYLDASAFSSNTGSYQLSAGLGFAAIFEDTLL